MERIPDLLERIARRLRPTQPVYPGHTYTCVVTEERFTVESVATNVSVRRKDAERRPESSVRLDTLRRAIETGSVVHDKQSCPACPDEDV